MTLYRRCGKRLVDLVVSALGIVIVSPILTFLSLVVWWTHGTPVLYRQQRPGWHGKPFTLYKFRTMTNACDDLGQMLPDAKRLTPVGRFLRTTSLDELPELFNVLKGDMSLVGPRPLLMQYMARYTLDQTRRHEARPGITGWAQVNGRNALTWKQKFELDVWYVDHMSFWLDAKILMKTFWKVLRREGISQEGHATMEEFLGDGN